LAPILGTIAPTAEPTADQSLVVLSVSIGMAYMRGASVTASLQLAFRRALADTLFLPVDDVGQVTVTDASAPVQPSNNSWSSAIAAAVEARLLHDRSHSGANIARRQMRTRRLDGDACILGVTITTEAADLVKSAAVSGVPAAVNASTSAATKGTISFSTLVSAIISDNVESLASSFSQHVNELNDVDSSVASEARLVVFTLLSVSDISTAVPTLQPSLLPTSAPTYTPTFLSSLLGRLAVAGAVIAGIAFLIADLRPYVR
jgi:hypothetical protein